MCEADADRAAATLLLDRVASDRHAWTSDLLTTPQGESLRTVTGIEPTEPFTPWAVLRERAGRAGLRLHGKGWRRQEARKALELVKRASPRPTVVLLLRDADVHPERLEAMAEVRGHYPGLVVALGMPKPELEAWWLLAVGIHQRPETLAEVRKTLGHDPTRTPERLNPKREDSKTSTKRVCGALGIDRPLAEAALAKVALAALEARGEACGLAGFLNELGPATDALYAG
ncbi:MAG: hypothetical protein KC613_04740 [Myxococcales bacterium]|nr:hypothetical protein [Myxococcales bacterium]